MRNQMIGICHGLCRQPQRRQSVFKRSMSLGLDPRMDTGSREENASKRQSGASLLIPSEAKML
jgi:hypothetical protein